MYKRTDIFFLIFFSLIITRVFAQTDEREKIILPRYETEEKKQIIKNVHVEPINAAGITNALPPQNPVRTMAEFEELDGIIVRWAYGSYDQLLSQIVDAAQEEGKVWILVRPATSDSTNIKNYLASANIPGKNIEFITVNTNSIWCRDYGPWVVYDITSDNPALVDFRYNRPTRPMDDAVPAALASRWSMPVYSTTQMPDSLAATGGNFMVDGFGTGFSSKLIADENPRLSSSAIDSIMLRYCGVDRYIKMDNLLYDGIHHIDMHMKLLNEETLLIGQYPVNTSDYTTIEKTVGYLKTIPDCYGRPYNIVRIPMPPSLIGGYPPNSSYFTYTNALIVNRCVLVPVYGFPLDQQALQIYRDAMPGYKIIGYDCNDIIPASGAIHCITKEIGVSEPVFIAHAPLADTRDTVNDYRIETKIKVRSGVDSAFVYWKNQSMSLFNKTVLNQSIDSFVGSLPHQTNHSHVSYYISVNTKSGRSVSKPIVAPAGTFEFDVTDSTRTDVDYEAQPLLFSLSQNYPNPVPSTSYARTIIQYALSKSAEVQLTVYNILGEEVAMLYNGSLERGMYTAVWNTVNLPGGIYFYQLRVTDSRGVFCETRKAVLMK